VGESVYRAVAKVPEEKIGEEEEEKKEEEEEE